MDTHGRWERGEKVWVIEKMSEIGYFIEIYFVNSIAELLIERPRRWGWERAMLILRKSMKSRVNNNNNNKSSLTHGDASGLTFTTQSSEPDAITLSLCGHHAMSSTGPLCPPTSGWSAGMRPTWHIWMKIVILSSKTNESSYTHFVMGKHDEGTAARRLNDNGEKFWIHCTKCRIPAWFWYTNIVVALFALQRLSIHMTKLWTSHNPKWHCLTVVFFVLCELFLLSFWFLCCYLSAFLFHRIMINKHNTPAMWDMCSSLLVWWWCFSYFRDGMIWRARWCTLYTLFSLVWRCTMMQFNDIADDSDEIQRKKNHHEENQREKKKKRKEEEGVR